MWKRKYQIETDILITALEGGSNYWYSELDWFTPKGINPDNYNYSNAMDDFLTDSTYFTLKDYGNCIEPEQAIIYKVKVTSIQKAILMAKENYPNVYKAIKEEYYDAADADVILQLAIFNEVIYG